MNDVDVADICETDEFGECNNGTTAHILFQYRGIEH